jgi:hypothetical protein
MDRITGACLCKSVRYALNGPIKAAANCHCNICKKMTGAAFATVAIVAEESLEITRGEKELSAYVVSDNATKYFCRSCGTPVFNVHKKFPGNRMLPVGALDDPAAVTPAINVYCESMLPWVKGIAELTSFDQGFTK